MRGKDTQIRVCPYFWAPGGQLYAAEEARGGKFGTLWINQKPPSWSRSSTPEPEIGADGGGGDCLRCRNKHMCNQEHSVCRGPGLQDQRAVGNECQDHC